MKNTGLKIAKRILYKKNKVGRITLSNIKADCITAIIKPVWY